MSKSLWESEAAEGSFCATAPAEQPVGVGALALSADDFSALEERIVRAVELVKKERQSPRCGRGARS